MTFEHLLLAAIAFAMSFSVFLFIAAGFVGFKLDRRNRE